MNYKEEFDLIVAGGGPAGIAAAVSAARNGIRVLLIERAGFLGGMATNAAVPAFCPYTDGKKVVIGGIGFEILEKLINESYVSPMVRIREKQDIADKYDWLPIDPEILKRIADQLVLESKCKVLLHTAVTGVNEADGEIISVNVYNKGGNFTIKAKYFIDCTGDADLVAMAGGAFEYGDQNGRVQSGTLCFRIANLDTERFMEYVKETGEDGNLTVAVQKAKEKEDFIRDERFVAGFNLQAENVAGLNFGHIYYLNPLDGDDLTRGEMEGRARLPELMNFLRKYVPGAETAVLVSSGPMIGIRESRRIIGDYQLSEQDYVNRADFEDTIARYSYPVDIHSPAPGSKGYELNFNSEKYKYSPGEAYSIPYRSLLPKGFKNLLAAGRTISSDRIMMSSVRVMPACFATGEAAGAAVALCCKSGLDLRRIQIKELQSQLKKQGAILS